MSRQSDEVIFCAGDCESSHWMFEPNLFLHCVQQSLERGMVQVGQRNHKPTPSLSNIDCEVAFGDVDGCHRRSVSGQAQPADDVLKPYAHDFQ